MSTVDGCACPLGGVADNLFISDAEQRVRCQQAAVAAEELTTPFRMLRRSMSHLWRGNGRMVRAGWTHSQRQESSHPWSTHGCCREVWGHRLAHVPPHVPFVAGRDRSTDEGSAGTDASRFYPDGDECLRTGDARVEKGSERGSERGGCHYGAPALEGERLNCQFSYWE